MKIYIMLICVTLFVFSSCQRSPEKLPKFKDAFRDQIERFEKQKLKTDKEVEDGVHELSVLQSALQEATEVDKEFNRVYGNWKKVNKQVERLYDDYEKLQNKANNLFGALEDQTNTIRDATTKQQLLTAINTTKADYAKTLSKTESAVSQLRTLHADAADIIKALEVAVALGQFAEIQSGLQSIEMKVDSIMKQLNESISESKDLYDSKISKF